MIISTYDPGHLHPSFGIDLGDIDLGTVEALGVGASFARVPPGRHSDPHQHDETETFVIFAGRGDIVVDAGRTPITLPMVVQFEPFETHYLDNTGDTDILFATFYWRDAPRAVKKAPEPAGGDSGTVRSSCSRPRRPRTAACTSATCPARTWAPTRSSGSSG